MRIVYRRARCDITPLAKSQAPGQRAFILQGAALGRANLLNASALRCEQFNEIASACGRDGSLSLCDFKRFSISGLLARAFKRSQKLLDRIANARSAARDISTRAERGEA